ncbi:MAG: excinuclease ABC subunit UvrA [Roseiflexus sp.]|jgi:excinuclease ABC subunit A|nr:excinuclease ABC subunit UvrA [Roseiflexus sp.]MBO9334303.1 excinuclease ABC subunit UvrA [Roseiflexus sp.]MBO9365165.1 excinuclease ABC subunit UvrA [Roseiflexus sp.]MBO9382853.1 excinuclease ABC subunit UvrA [Roseiflexus sp.]MBO9389718.1 excinuclease ABC subunit UvrA [Roseiflexus sp.]
MAKDAIVIKGAREHNLKGINLEIPRDKLVVLTGVSGSGKSSLAFDTLYAEGQRRYVESLSAYARQFLGQMEKPKVDYIGGLSPAIAIEQKSASKNPRSTVGTVTEIYDYLRLLYARVGTQHCHVCGRPVSSQSAEQIVNRVLTLPVGTRFMVLAPLVSQRKGEYKDVFAEARAEGFARVRVDGEIRDLASEIKLNKKVKHTIEIVVDRLTIPAREGATDESHVPHSPIGKAQAGAQSDWDAFVTRLTDSVEQALRVGEGQLIISIQNPSSDPEEWLMSEANTCVHCGISFPELSPQMFSFNSPQGACPECTGLGVRMEVDPLLLVPNPSLTLHEGAVTYWGELRKKRDSWGYRALLAIAHHYGFDLDTPWEQLSEQARHVIIYGSGKERIRFRWGDETSDSRGEFMRPWEGLASEIRRRYQQTGSDYTREYYQSFMSEQPCPACDGARLRPESLAVRVGGWSLRDVTRLTIAGAMAWVHALSGMPVDSSHLEALNGHVAGNGATSHLSVTPLSDYQMAIVSDVLKEIRERLGFLLNVGLHYLTLERPAPTLSGGEAQRIRLASQIGSGLVGVTYILDEPSIGLHQRDNRKLLNTLMKLRDLGNTVIVVEHDLETMQAADWIIDFGPGAGVKGGEVVAAGPPDLIAATPDSLTGAYLSGRLEIPVPRQRRTARVRPVADTPHDAPRRHRRTDHATDQADGPWLELEGATKNNLRDVTVRFPLGVFICVTGVSGSGKSSLITETLYPALANRLNRAQLKPGPFRALRGVEHLDKVIDIDQQPIGRTPRSNPATYVKLFDLIRELFASTNEAKLRGYNAGRFSFNLKGGRCEACEGNGEKRIDMQFLADVWVRCDVCKGKRYNRETLQVRYKGKSIADVLDMDVQTALEFFDNVPRIRRILQTLHDVGLDYIKLGQSATTLSGGEAQRVKLAKELARTATGRTMYILDEPTTGLHFADVQRLLTVLHRLVDAGNTVLVIEHNLDVIKTADWIIDMGPEGGDGGGRVVATGTPEEVALIEESHTGRYLREILYHHGIVARGMLK